MLDPNIAEQKVTVCVITPSSKNIGKDCREVADLLSADYVATYKSMAPTALQLIRGTPGYYYRDLPATLNDTRSTSFSSSSRGCPR